MQAILRTAAECRQWSTGQRSDGNVRAAWRRYHRLILLAVFSGLRPSEQRGLAWPQVDLDAGKVSVVQRADQYGVIGARSEERRGGTTCVRTCRYRWSPD